MNLDLRRRAVAVLFVAVMVVPFKAEAQFGNWGAGQESDPNKAPAVCAGGPVSEDMDELGDLVEHMVDGELHPDVFDKCAKALLARLPAPQSSRLLDEMGKGYRTLLRKKQLE